LEGADIDFVRLENIKLGFGFTLAAGLLIGASGEWRPSFQIASGHFDMRRSLTTG
jgi:hypothetical protein